MEHYAFRPHAKRRSEGQSVRRTDTVGMNDSLRLACSATAIDNVVWIFVANLDSTRLVISRCIREGAVVSLIPTSRSFASENKTMGSYRSKMRFDGIESWRESPFVITAVASESPIR
jgi:hypothetical protein